MKTILGTGQLGIAIMEILLQQNPAEAILLVNRTGKLNMPVPNNVSVLAADVTSKNEMEVVAQQSEVIFSCTDVSYQQWENFYPATANALAYALSKSNARLVFADNLYSYGNVQGTVMNEAMPHKAKTKKGMIRAAVIATLLYSKESFSNRVAFVKAADFIGPRIHKGIFGADFLERLQGNKTIALFGKPALPHTFTYIKDFATAMINVGIAAGTFGQVWHVPNAPAINLYEWVHNFETATGKKTKVIVLPKFVVRIAGLFNSLIKEFYELGYQFEYPYLVDDKKYVQRFGNHATSHQTIAAETIAWYNQTQTK